MAKPSPWARRFIEGNVVTVFSKSELREIATIVDAARKEGRRDGIECAAKVTDRERQFWPPWDGGRMALAKARDLIRALAIHEGK